MIYLLRTAHRLKICIGILVVTMAGNIGAAERHNGFTKLQSEVDTSVKKINGANRQKMTFRVETAYFDKPKEIEGRRPEGAPPCFKAALSCLLLYVPSSDRSDLADHIIVEVWKFSSTNDVREAQRFFCLKGREEPGFHFVHSTTNVLIYLGRESDKLHELFKSLTNSIPRYFATE